MKMPRISDDRVQERALPNVGFNVQGEDFGGENAQRINQAAQGMISQAMEIQEKARKEADESVQLEAGAQLAEFELDWNNRTREARGENAMKLDAEYKDSYTKLQGNMGALAKNRRQQEMIGRLMLSTDSQLRNNISAHQSRENAVVYKDKSEAFIVRKRQAAISSMDPNRIAESILEQQAAVDQLADFMGEPQEVRDIMKTEVATDTKIEYIQRLADTDTDKAREVLSKESSGIDSDIVLKMEGYISRREKQLKVVAKNAQIDTDIAFMIDFTNKQDMDMSVLLKSDKKGPTPELAQAVVAFQTDPNLISLENTPVFTAYAEQVFNTHDKGAISKLLIDAVSGGPDGKVNVKELQSLVKITAIRSQGMTLADWEDRQKEGDNAVKKSFIDNAWDGIKSWVSSFASNNDTKARVYKDLINEVDANPPKSAEDANKVVSAVIERAQAATNPNRTAYKLDQQITYDGITYVVIGFDEDGEPLVDEVK